MRILALAALTAGFICAQDNKGVAAQWDVAKTLDAIAAHTRRLMPLIEQIHPQDWVAKGAPDTYVSQWNSSRAQAKALIDAASALQRAPERLSGELEALFRLNGLENSVRSLAEGLRKYQNPSLAELLLSVVSENGGNRERLQQYIVDLAAEKEQEFQIADREAQRCRGTLSRQQPQVTNRKK